VARFGSGRRQAASTFLGRPASPSLPEPRPLTLGATLILIAALNILVPYRFLSLLLFLLPKPEPQGSH